MKKIEYILDIANKVCGVLTFLATGGFIVFRKNIPVDKVDFSKNILIFVLTVCVGLIALNNWILKRKEKRVNKQLELKIKEIEGLMEKYENDLSASVKEMEGEIQNSFVLLKSTCNLIRKSVIDIHEKKEKYVNRIYSAKSPQELEVIKKDYLDDYEKLFCTPTMNLVNIVRSEMILFSKRVFNLKEDFRVVVKLVHPDKNTEKREEWEFSNSIWDNNSWESKIKFYREKENQRCKIGNNSAIRSLATGGSHYFLCNDLVDRKNSGGYKSHNEKWEEIYNAKILTKVENRKKRILYGFLSIDTLNSNKKDLFCGDVKSIPFNIAFYASEALAVLLGELESYYKELSLVYSDRAGSIVHMNRRVGDKK